MSLLVPENAKQKRTCDDCGKEYSCRQSLSKHRTDKHPEEVKKKQQESFHSKCQEEGCVFAAPSIDKLRDHLTAVHQMSFTVVQKTFPSMDGKEMTEVSAPKYKYILCF